jgi:hypothetical protein
MTRLGEPIAHKRDRDLISTDSPMEGKGSATLQFCAKTPLCSRKVLATRQLLYSQNLLATVIFVLYVYCYDGMDIENMSPSS